MVRYFLDTYAIIEIIKGNKNYEKYLNFLFYTSIFNLYELYYILLRDRGEVFARNYFNNFKEFVIPINESSIFFASKFRIDFSKKKFSYIDALGYAMAFSNDVKFLTGDKEFENLENVEFVK